MAIPAASTAPPLDDSTLARRIAGRDQGAFEALMRRYNPRLFRVARAMLKDDAAAEDVLQEAYLDAYTHITHFRGDATLATWLTRLVVNRSLMRLRKDKRDKNVVAFDQEQIDMPDRASEAPDKAALRAEVRRSLERRIDELPQAFRAVFVMREVEDLSVAETAECLGLPPATVRSRLFRARALLREAFARDMDTAVADVFSFDGPRCDRIVAAVLRGTSALSAASNGHEKPTP
jgi:RNA polymerase sigma-70 factor (ECF subfamily)